MSPILDRIFPIVVNNDYGGNPCVVWVFWLLTIISIVRSLVHMLKFDGGAETIATIPLRKFPSQASETIVSIFAIWGISQLLMALVYLVILWRYNSLLPFGCLLFTTEYLLRLLVKPVLGKKVHTEGQAPGGVGNYACVPIGIILFWLSLPL